MRIKKRGLLESMILLLSGIFVFYGLSFASGWYISVHEPLKLDFPVPIYSKNNVSYLQEQVVYDDSIASVYAVSQLKVIPGGQSIGVLLHSQGVIVVGYSAVQDSTGKKNDPAGDAGVHIGDIILKANNEEIKSEEHVRDLVADAGSAGQALKLEVRRGKDIYSTQVNPVYCEETSRYRIGLLIKDSAAGLGTLTFYHPESMIYGALGHVITDIGSTEPFDLSEGKIVGASVQTINRGKRGQPGEKVGVFLNDQQINGTILKNTTMGIFGNLSIPLETNDDQLVSVKPANQIREGAAEILTVLKDEQVEKFTVEISKINLKSIQDGKGFVIKVTDPRLLEQAGGIVQGMSGSPIIQDNSLVGAVTHVFINDPTRGYGVPLEWMIMETEIPSLEKNSELAS